MVGPTWIGVVWLSFFNNHIITVKKEGNTTIALQHHCRRVGKNGQIEAMQRGIGAGVGDAKLLIA